MKSILKMYLSLVLLGLVAACSGQGGALDGGFDGGGPVGGGQGQPTIAPGADHQPGIPVDEEDDQGPSNLAAPGQEPDEPEDPKPAHTGPSNLKQ